MPTSHADIRLQGSADAKQEIASTLLTCAAGVLEELAPPPQLPESELWASARDQLLEIEHAAQKSSP